jgi:hypothetical protein
VVHAGLDGGEMKKDTKFEMAYSNDPHGIAKAVQAGVLGSMQDVLRGMATDNKLPGLTWDQLNWFIEEFKKKDPVVIEQGDEM